MVCLPLGVNPNVAARSEKFAFHIGFLSSSVPLRFFILSVSSTSVTPPKYSKAWIRQRLKALALQRLANSVYMALSILRPSRRGMAFSPHRLLRRCTYIPPVCLRLLSRLRLVSAYGRRLPGWSKILYVIPQYRASAGISFCLYPFVDDFAVEYALIHWLSYSFLIWIELRTAPAMRLPLRDPFGPSDTFSQYSSNGLFLGYRSILLFLLLVHVA